MFRLFRITNRSFKMLTQMPYVGISGYAIDCPEGERTEGVSVDFGHVESADARYALVIPYDKIDSVVERLLDSKARYKQR